ncbi:MAG TPA: site-specific integrase, partial [bacterium]|nr:site-specific integrase [bacterium]
MGRPNALKLPKFLRRKEDGTYYIDCYVTLEDGTRKRRMETLGKIPKALAEKIHLQKMAELAEGRYFKQRVSFIQAADSFMEYSRSRKRTWQSDEQKIAVMKAHFGNIPLDVLNADRVERFLNKLRESGSKGKPLKLATLNLYIACLKTLVNRAVNNNLLERNPIRGLKLFKANNVRDRTLSQDEHRRLLEACSEHLRPIFVLAYDTGMRRGEILGLRWDQVDYAKGRIRLEAADTKTNEAREIPLDASLMEMLRRQPVAFGSPYVFSFKGRPVADVKTAFNAACARAGIKDFRFHDLRHCAVTNMRKAGVPAHVIMSVSGHKTMHMLHRYDKVDAQDRLA